MRAPYRYFFPRPLVGLGWLAPWMVLAQNAPLPPSAPSSPHPLPLLSRAPDPAAPTAALVHAALPADPWVKQQAMRQDWRAAHAAVGTFVRGHADIVAWEAQQATANATALPDPGPTPATPALAPMGSPESPGMVHHHSNNHAPQRMHGPRAAGSTP